MSRPSETLQATVSSIIGALLIIYGAVKDGFDLDRLASPEVLGAITVIVGFVSAAVTWYTARKQRASELGSAPDGTVVAP